MVDFSYYRNDNQEEYKRFNCDYCKQKDLCDKRMVCYLEENEKTLLMPNIPNNFHKQIDVSQNDIYTQFDRVEREVDKKELIEYYNQIRELFPNERAFKVWTMPLMRLGLNNQLICPLPFFDKKLSDIVNWESAADKYGVLPYEGAYLDQPLYVIEGFNICRTAESKYTNTKLKKSKKSAKSSANKPQTRPKRRR